MTFKSGTSGNPEGRPKGAPNKRTQLAKLLEPHAEQLVSKLITLALAGDSSALRLCIERLIPKMKSEAVDFVFSAPDMKKPEAIFDASRKILEAISDQTITPEQGKILLDALEAHRKNIETCVLEERVKQLEKNLNCR